MPTNAVPIVLQYLKDAQDISADAALVEALPFMEGSSQVLALKVLIHRGHLPSLAKAITYFHDASESLRTLLRTHLRELSKAIPLALDSTEFEQRAAAVEAAAAADDASSAYLLVDLLRSSCLRTREVAATALRGMTAGLISRRQLNPLAASSEGSESQSTALTAALAEAVRTWDIHLQPRALEAAMWLGIAIVPALRPKLDDERSGFSRIVRRRLETGSDPRMAEFLWCALAIPAVRASAAQAIASARDPSWIKAICGHSKLLDDAEIERGFRHVRSCKWLDAPPDALLRLLNGDVATIVRLTVSMGTTAERKVERLRTLITTGHPALIREVTVFLIGHSDELTTQLLTLVARRGDPDVVRLAQMELKRRQSGETVPATLSSPSNINGAQVGASDWERCFDVWENLPSFERMALLDEWETTGAQYDAKLRAKLRGTLADDRRKALAIIREWGATPNFADDVYRTAHDADPVVRSLAMVMLGQLPGASSERILRAAMKDSDPRVQANAIEALDQLHVADRVACIRPKLQAVHPRVRANAIRSLLRLELHEAGEALLQMLEDESGPQRASALWVVERLRLQAVLQRVIHMSHNDPDERVRHRAQRIIDELHGSRFTPHPMPTQETARTKPIRSGTGR